MRKPKHFAEEKTLEVNIDCVAAARGNCMTNSILQLKRCLRASKQKHKRNSRKMKRYSRTQEVAAGLEQVKFRPGRAAPQKRGIGNEITIDIDDVTLSLLATLDESGM